jgi:hypothetical protein
VLQDSDAALTRQAVEEDDDEDDDDEDELAEIEVLTLPYGPRCRQQLVQIR